MAKVSGVSGRPRVRRGRSTSAMPASSDKRPRMSNNARSRIVTGQCAARRASYRHPRIPSPRLQTTETQQFYDKAPQGKRNNVAESAEQPKTGNFETTERGESESAGIWPEAPPRRPPHFTKAGGRPARAEAAGARGQAWTYHGIGQGRLALVRPPSAEHRLTH